MNTSDFITKARMVHGIKYDYSSVDYKGSKTKVSIICPIHGAFEQTPDKHLNGRCGCPACAGNSCGSTESFAAKAAKVHDGRYDYSLTTYVNNKTPVAITCPVHGVYYQTPSNHLAGKGCPKCANNVLLNCGEFEAKARAVHGDAYDYSRVEYCGNRQPVEIVCRRHGSFFQRPYAHLLGAGCPQCGRILQAESRDETAIRAKTRQTLKQRYGVENPMDVPGVRERHLCSVQSEAVRAKRNSTKMRNHSFNTSLPEYRLGCLLRSVFGDAGVLDGYTSDVYPYVCDYYIPHRDLYVELNAHWSHGGHWFTSDDEDTVRTWRQLSKYYQNAAETFSVRDVEKRAAARLNSLNYLVFWKPDLSDAKAWIAAGCPDAHDWEREYSWKSDV